MIISIFLPLISAIFVFGLGIFAYYRNPKSKLNIIFSLLCLSVSIWLFGTFMMFLNRDNDPQAIFWDRFIYAGVVFVPSLFYHFSLEFRKINKKKLLILSYILSFIFLIISRTDYFVSGLFKYPWGVHTQAKFFHHIFLIFFSIYLLLVLINFYKAHKKFKGIQREQARYLLLAFFILITVGSTAYFPAYKISIYPFSFTSGVIFTVITAYAIIKYRLMDIRFALGRTSVYLLSFFSVAGVGSLLIFLNNQLSQPISFNIFFPLSIVIAVIAYQLFFKLYEKLASKYFYYTLYSYKKVLTELGRKLTGILDLNRLSNLLAATLIETMKLDRAVILQREKAGNYNILKNIGFKEENGISLVRDNFLTRYLQKRKKLLVYEELSLIQRDSQDEQEKKELEKLKGNMKRIKAEVCLPLFWEEKIIGMIVLGRKISKGAYSKEDLELLSFLSSQASIAFQNARLYNQIQDLSQNLQEKVDEQIKELRSAYEELKKIDEAKTEFISMASHQLRTPLTSIKGYVSMLLEGDYGELGQKKGDILNKVFQSNERLIKIVGDLLNISRIELGKMKLNKTEVRIEDLVKSCYEEMSIKAKQKNLVLIFKNPSEKIPKLNIDELKIRQAILNLIDNAIRYTKKGKIEVSIQKKIKSVAIIIKDTGVGLTTDERKTIFEDFSRGSAGINLFIEGVGLGLSIARKYLELHRGKIWVESEGKNKGSTFYIELPFK